MDTMDNRVQKGLFLKQAREAKGISLRTVHEATKIPLDALHAIEEGYTIRTLSSFYYRGFIKIYAQFLNVDPKNVLEETESQRSSRRYTQESKSGSSSVSAFRAVPGLSSEVLMNVGKFILAVFVLVIFFKIVGFVFYKITHRVKAPETTLSPTIPEATSSKKPIKLVTKVTKEPSQAQAVPLTTSSSAKPVATKQSERSVLHNVNVSVKAKKDSWLRVETDGNVVFQSVIKRGGVETWSAKEKVEISGKNIADLNFEFNGKVIDSLARKDRRAKKIIITKDGFTVQ